MYDFLFSRAKSIEEAIELLKTDDSQFLAGGQTLIPTLKQRLANPDHLISLAKIPEMIGVKTTKENKISVGAATTHDQVYAETKSFPALSYLAGRIGDPAVRQRGTIGGSLANNDPSACYPAAALGSGAVVVTNLREISSDDFFLGMFETSLEEKEIITHVIFPIPTEAIYLKFEQPASRFALVGVFLAIFENQVRLAVTGASTNGVFRWEEAEKRLNINFTAESLDNLVLPYDSFIEDIHGTAEYRAHLVSVLTKRAIPLCKNRIRC